MPHFQHNTVVWQWANDTILTGDSDFDLIVAHVRNRKDMPHRFPNATFMRDYLTRTGCSNVVAYRLAWDSYYEYNSRVSNPGMNSEVLAASRSEAKRLGRPTFKGLVCSRDPGHGTLRRTANGECLGCRKLYRQQWERRRSGAEMIELPEPSEAERAIFEAALVKTPRRS